MERWLYKVVLRCRSLFRSRRVEEELDEELHFHLDRQIQAHLDRGLKGRSDPCRSPGVWRPQATERGVPRDASHGVDRPHVARRSVRNARASSKSWLHDGGHPVSGAGHRGQHGHLSTDRRDSSATPAGPSRGRTRRCSDRARQRWLGRLGEREFAADVSAVGADSRSPTGVLGHLRVGYHAISRWYGTRLHTS